MHGDYNWFIIPIIYFGEGCMEDNQISRQDIEQQLHDVSANREIIEQRLKDTQAQLNALYDLFNEDLENLKIAQNSENNLREQLADFQKNAIKDAINLEGFSKLLGEATPFLARFKDKAFGKIKAVKEIIDGSAFDKVWVEERYEEYKQICIEQGKDVKSREEFEQIALTLRNVSEDSTNLSLYDLLGKVSHEAGSAKEHVRNVWQSVRLSDHFVNFLGKQNQQEQEEVLDKKTVLNQWIETRDIKKSVSKMDVNELYSDYILFVEFAYGPEQVEELTYTTKNGAFVTALSRHFDGLKHDIQDDTKRVGLKIRKP